MWFSKPSAVYFYDDETDVSNLESEDPITAEFTQVGEGEVIAAPGVGSRLGIRAGTIHNGDTVPMVVELLDGSGGTVRWKAPLGASGGGSILHFGRRGLLLTPNNPLIITLSGAGLVYVNVTDYFIA